MMNKTCLKVENKIKYLGINMTNVNCMLFQNNYCMLRLGMKFLKRCVKHNCHCWGKFI